MFKKLVFILAIVTLVALVASAGTVPSGSRYRITLSQNSVLQGTELKAGDYRISIADSKIMVTGENGKNPVEIPVKVETQDQKFESTVVRYDTSTGKAVISEIRLGGTKTKLIFNN